MKSPNDIIASVATEDLAKQIRNTEALRQQIRQLNADRAAMGKEIDRLKEIATRAYQVLDLGLKSGNCKDLARYANEVKRALGLMV